MATGSQHVVLATGKLEQLDAKVFSQEQLWAAGKRKRAAPKISGKRAKGEAHAKAAEEESKPKEEEPVAKTETEKPAPMES